MWKHIWKSTISLVLVLVIASGNIHLETFAAEAVNMPKIPIVQNDEFPDAINQTLMSAAIIANEEKITIAEINNVINAFANKMAINAIGETSTLIELDPAQIGLAVLELHDTVYCTSDYLYTSDYENGILYQWMYFADGSISKNVSCKYNGVIYCVTNDDNLFLKKGNSTMYEIEDRLSDEELSEFFEMVESGNVLEKEVYSIDDVRMALGTGGISQIATTPVSVFASGDYNTLDDFKPLNAKKISEVSVTISGMSKYHNGTDTAIIRVFDTRKTYVESETLKKFFDAASTVMEIVSYAELAFAPTLSVLQVAGVIASAGSVLTKPIYFYKSQTYTMATYRESQIYDYTVENAYVELPQLYSPMAISMVYANYKNGVYETSYWAVTGRPVYNIPSEGTSDATVEQYAEYAAKVYYRNCVLQGKWTHGRTAYGGLGG